MNLYFDNATTTFPKPPEVAQAIVRYIEQCGGSYGRAAYGRIVDSSSIVEHCRDLMAVRLNAATPDHVFFTMNATYAANIILKGLALKKVLVSPLEHNAIMRPLGALGVEIGFLPCDASGLVDIEKDIDTDGVSLVIVNHQSNVNGVIQPIEDISRWAKSKRIPLMVDTSQSLGYLPIEVDYAVFTGHKSLFGTTGTGGFYAKNPDTIATFIHGGTGSRSDSLLMPEFYPDRFEAGTPNIAGLAGLCAGLENPPIPQHSLFDFLNLLDRVEGYSIYRSSDEKQQGELFSLTHHKMKPSEIAYTLYAKYNIECRSGLHCAPIAHRTLGTFPDGTVRISLSPYHTTDDLDYLHKALTEICQ